MTISQVVIPTPSATGAGANQLVFVSDEGNLQIVFCGHRTGTLTPSIDGAGWSSPYLIESEIADTNARRALVMYWRVVPAGQSATVNVNFSASTTKSSVGFEFSTDTAGGTWSFSASAPDGRNNNSNGTTASALLASNSVAPEFAEAVAVDGVTTRHGLPADEDSYSDSFIVGPSATSGTTANNISTFSGYKIVDAGPAAMSTTATWTTAALATSIIGVWSVSSGAVAETVTLDGTLPALQGAFAIDAGVVAVIFDGNLLRLTADAAIAVSAGAELAGELPRLAGNFAIASSAGIALSGQLPGLQGSFLILEADLVDVQLDGTLPGLQGSFTIAVEVLIVGRPIQPTAQVRPLQPEAALRPIQQQIG